MGEKIDEIVKSAGKPDSILNDLMREKAFLGGFKDGEIKEKGIGSMSEKMVEIYNQQVEHLIRLWVDIDLFNSLILAEPNVQDYVQQKMKAEANLRRKRKVVDILRGYIGGKEN